MSSAALSKRQHSSDYKNLNVVESDHSCFSQVAVQCDCGRRKETVVCTEAASSYQRSVKWFRIDRVLNVNPLKHLGVSVLQVCSHRHGQ